MPTVAENIRRIRKEKSLTQKQLGDLCDPPMADSAIRRYELGKANPKIETLSKIAHALDVTIGDLDSNYSIMGKDREAALSLITQLKQFSTNISHMDITDESKVENMAKISELIKESQQLIDMIDVATSADRKKKSIKENIKKAEQSIDDMLLSLLHQLNSDGQEKVIMYTIDLIKIPEYCENHNIPTQSKKYDSNPDSEK